MTAPNPLGPDGLRRVVGAAGIDAEPRWFESIGSTNTEAVALARAGAPEWTVVAAGHQTAGRGRLGRSWADLPGGSLLFSMILRPALEPARAPLITLLASVEMVEACELQAMRSKWPNDLVVDDRKVGGILAEAELAGRRVDHVVLGIGLNLGSAGGARPAPDATTLAAEGARADPEPILARFLSALRRSLAEDPSLSGVPVRYAAICSTIGRWVTVALPGDGQIEGRAAGIGADAALLVESGGRRQVVPSGEVVNLRGRGGGR